MMNNTSANFRKIYVSQALTIKYKNTTDWKINKVELKYFMCNHDFEL